MFAEIEREKRKALATHNWRGGQLGARILLIAVYAFLVGLIIRYPQSIEPIAMFYILLVLVVIIMPAMMHGAIAGDRERRSLDLLLTAPVTPGQIVIGKLARGFGILLAVWLAIGIPTIIIEIMQQLNKANYYYYDSFGIAGFVRAMLLILVTGVFIATLSLWMSSRMKTNASALLATVGALFAFFVLVPIFAGVMSIFDNDFSSFIMNIHPFVALSNTSLRNSGIGSTQLNEVGLSWLCMLIQIACSYAFVYMARNNVWALSKGRMQ